MAGSEQRRLAWSAYNGRPRLPCCLECYSIGSEPGRSTFTPKSIPVLHRAWLIALLLILGAACREAIFREMSDSTYIKTMVALRRLPLGIDSVSRARQRDSVLRAF